MNIEHIYILIMYITPVMPGYCVLLSWNWAVPDTGSQYFAPNLPITDLQRLGTCSDQYTAQKAKTYSSGQCNQFH